MTNLKRLTNEQIIKKLLVELQPMEVLILRERIQNICDQTLVDPEKIKQGMRENGIASVIHPDFFIRTVEKIKKIVDNEDSSAPYSIN